MKQKRRLLSCFLAVSLALGMSPAEGLLDSAYDFVTTVDAASPGDKLSVGYGTSQHKGTSDGYSYEIWIDQTGGNGTMTLGQGASFKAEWSANVSAGNFLARRGLDFGSKKKATDYEYIGLDYEADYRQTGSANGNSRLCVYGWFQNKGAAGNVPLVEYYIIEDWVDWCPDAPGKMVTIDGAQYKIFQMDHTGPTINGGSETFKQYFSVRQSKRKSGHITVSDHFKAWAAQGWGIGNLYEVALNAEGWQSSGVADIKKLDVYTTPKGETGYTPPTTETPQQPSIQGTAPSGSGTGISDGFEGSGTTWTGRGDGVKLLLTSDLKSGGSKSLAVTGRTASWNGVSASSSELKAGGSYSFSSQVTYKNSSYASSGFEFGVQYDLNGETNYDNIGSATTSSGKWADLSGKFTIPTGAENISLYIQSAYTESDTAADMLDFFIDDVKLSSSGSTGNTGNNNTGNNNTGNNNTGNNNGTSVSTSDSLKGKFASCFKMGTSVSPRELSSGADFIKKHFNSITPENELKPDSLLQQQASIQGGDNTHAVVSLRSAAQTLKFCEDNNIGVRGHTFVWYSQTPDWFFREGFQSNGNYVSADIMNKRLENFIKDTFDLLKKEYPNLNVYAYDVCNELFLNDGGGLRPGGNASSGGSNWTRIYSDDSFIINAFTYARKYAPAGCKLYINDYNEYIPAKTNDIYNIAMKLKQKGVIDGIGMQSHLDVSYPSAQVYKTALEKFLSTGLEVSITELDITTSNNFTAQASLFKQIFEMAVENRDQIPSFTVWGTHDPISWRSSQNPLLFGNNYTEKEAYKQVMSINVPSGGSNNDNNNNGDTNIPVVTTTVLNPGTSVKFGDINGDGDIDLSDLTLISLYLLGDRTLSADQKLAANVSYDSSVDVADLALLKQYISKDNVQLGKGYTGNTSNSQGNSNTNQGSNNGSINGSAPTGSGTGISDGFEGSGTTWAARGEDVSILLTNSLKRSGSKSLAVTGRTASWNGISASSSDLAAGGSYSFDSYVTYNNNTYSTAGFEFGVQYDLGGETQYENVGSATTSSGKWAELSGDFSVPAGATNVSLYIQSAYTESDTAADMIDFFVDDVQFTKNSSNTGNSTTTPSSGTMVGSVSNGTWSSTCDTSWIDPSKPMVAFTFDDGPVGTASNATSIRIQNALTKNGYHATFFYWGQKINGSNSAEIKRAFDAGFEIGNHTYSHPYLTNLSASGVQSEINQTKTILNGIVGNGDFLVRPPYLSVNGTVQSAAGVPLINCGIDTEDWNNASKDAIVNKLKSAMQNGSLNKQIVLMHETYETTAAAMEELLPYMKSQGWQVVSVSELFKASGKQLKAGTAYTSAK